MELPRDFTIPFFKGRVTATPEKRPTNPDVKNLEGSACYFINIYNASTTTTLDP